ncbi:flagellar hook-associated protein FlgK [Magnetovibrio sp.]|uniref:flagellar hook-associated protein FlgK n=1 Tax=Magnetovibrio sp. TaxID=2024836 RepID=UPI002F946C71
MSGSLTLALRTAQSGLLVNQSALDAVAQNVANVNSPDYSRKIVNMEQRVVAGTGAGVQLSQVTRAVDEGLLKSLRLELSAFNQHDAQSSYFSRLQDLFGAPGDNTSIAHIMTEFGKSMEALTLAPDQSLEQGEFVRQAKEVANKLTQMSSTVQELRVQADTEIAAVTSTINTLASELSDINNKIIQNSSTSADVTDLRDKRDAKLDELAGYIDISYFYRGDGDVVVFTRAGRTLVDNSSPTISHLPASTAASTTTHAEGDFNGIYIGIETAANDITDEVRDGKLKGLIDLRDGTLADLQSQLDEFAAELRDAVNLIHNQGSGFPGSATMSGTRAFINTGTAKTVPIAGEQTITMGNNSDTRITLFDSTGNQHTTTTVQAIMASASYGSGASAANGPWNIAEVAATMQDWLRQNGTANATVAVSSTTGKLNINLNSTTYNIALRDEVNTAGTVPAPVGSTAANATIQFDANGDGTADETVSGFSNFFGLNDLFVDDVVDNIWETGVMSTSYASTAATLTIYNGTTSTNVTVNNGDSLTTIAASINAATAAGVTATIIPDGSGQRLRISSQNGNAFTVTQAAANTFISDTSLHSADVRVSEQIRVREDIISSPSLVTRGAIQWDANKGASGEYFLSKGDNTLIKSMSQMFATTNTFDAAGGLSSTSMTFVSRSTSILTNNATLAELNDSQRTYQEDLSNSLKTKSDTFRGVNLDEEMSNLILFEQGYNAAARVISVIQAMFDSLERVIR